jgi:hypothetical protein
VSALLNHVWALSRAQDRVWAQVSGLPASISDRRLLMVFQAYIDDSYTSGGVFVLAGYIATTEVWAKFSKEWEEMLPFGVRAKDGRFHFKMSEMASSPERLERVGAFYRIIESYDLTSISCNINIAELRRAAKRLWSPERIIDWGPFSDPFFFTFRALIDCVHDHRDKFPSLPDEKIDFIFDEQSQKSIIFSAWDQFLASRRDHIRPLFGATPRFEDDKDFLPLQAADLWTWWVRAWRERGSPTFVTDDGIINMVLRGLVASKTSQRAILISYDEDQITVILRDLALIQTPGVTVYDLQYKGDVWP